MRIGDQMMVPARRIAVWFVSALTLVVDPYLAYGQPSPRGYTPTNWQVAESGAFAISTPIAVPTGTAGLQPKLSLGFSSEGGGGLLGSGGGISGFSAVQRCGKTLVQDQVNRGVLYDSNDRFCLDGQRLVLISGASYGADGAEYRTERESYTRIKSYGTAGNGPAWFKAWTKDGRVLEYGNTTDSRIEAQGKTSVRVWALNKLSDTSGNYLTLTYAEDNPNGDFRPTRIDYTGHISPAVTPYASTQFLYETRTDNAPFYVGGSKISVQQRLTNAKTYLGTTLVRDYRIGYEYGPTDNASRATAVTECDGAGACFSPVTLGWINSTGSVGFGNLSGVWGSQFGVLGDINGDGRADLASVACTGGTEAMPMSCDVAFALNAGTGFGTPTVLVTGLLAVPMVSLGDVNGDGKADLLINNALRFSNGAGFGSPNTVGGGGLLGDINGDGLADLVAMSCTPGSEVGPGNCDVWVALSNGSAFGQLVYQGSHSNTGPASLGDVNGDGRMDLYGADSGLRFSNGAGFDAPVSYGPAGGGLIGDVNGDGLADLVMLSCNAGTEASPPACNGNLWLSNGQALQLSSGSVACGYSPLLGTGVLSLGDVDGDGRADVSCGGIAFANATTGSRIAGVTSSLGANVTTTYKPLTDTTVYTKDTDAVWPVRDIRELGPRYVVATLSQSDGIGGTRSGSYFYRGAKQHLKGGGFLGFRQTELSDTPSGVKTISTFRQTYPYHGLPQQVDRQRISGGTLLSRLVNTWTDNPSVNALPYTYTTGNYHRSDLTQSVETSYELSASLITTVTSTHTYDAYGNALTVNLDSGGGYSRLTTNTYTNDTTNWFLGRLLRTTVASTAP